MQMTKLQDKDLEAFYGGHIPEEVSPYSAEELAWMGEEDRETFTRPVFSVSAAPVAKKRGRPAKKK
jgi:hypothetical protein